MMIGVLMLLALILVGNASALFESSICGISNFVIEPEKNSNRLLEGMNVGKDFFPWLAALEYENGVNCTGSIISRRHILTATHCVNEPADQIIYIRVGNSIISEMIQVKFESIVTHEDFNETTYANDIAIVTLQESLTFSESIAPICLPLHFKASKSYIYAGFGIVIDGIRDENITFPRPRQDVIFHDTTRARFGKLNSKVCEEEVDKICVSGSNGVTSADSGGPLMAFENGHWFLEGIASQAALALLKNENMPDIQALHADSIFVKTSMFCDWIEKQTNNEALCQRHTLIH